MGGGVDRDASGQTPLGVMGQTPPLQSHYSLPPADLCTSSFIQVSTINSTIPTVLVVIIIILLRFDGGSPVRIFYLHSSIFT